VATGCGANGGYAEYIVVPQAAAFAIPEVFADEEAAPLLCAGGVGFRALRMAAISDGQTLGFYGFGASAHLVLAMARHRYPNSMMCVITRTREKQRFARELGAHWAGPPGSSPPRAFDAVIDTTPVWSAIAEGLELLAPGGRMVVNAIRKTDGDKDALLRIGYDTHLWMEKNLVTVANVTGADISAALEQAAEIPLRPTVQTYPLEEANQALTDLAIGAGKGAKVLTLW
jgi:propanol-preferring alcohol dehydrogenase